MSGLSPVSVLFSSDGYELATVNGNAIPTGNRGLLVEGSDGTNSRFVSVDTSGRLIIVGSTAAGAGASTNLVTIQGNATGTPVPVSGTVTANNASVSTTGTAPPGSATYIGASVTTAAPTYTTGQMSALSLTTAGLLRVDGSGVTQPVSGTVTSNIGTTGGLALDATLAKLTIAQSTALGSNTQALVGGSVTTGSPTYTTGNINPFSLTTAGALRVDGSATTQPVSGTVTANAGTGNFTVVQATAASLNATIIGTTAAGSGASTGLVTIQGNASGTPIPVSGTVTANNASVGTDGSAALSSDTQIGAKVTTAAPSYTTGNLNSLSLTTSGLLRIDGVYPINATTPTTDIHFVGASVTTAAPTYTTGQLSALSLTTAGALRIDGSGSTQPVSGTVTSNQGTAGTAAQGWFSKVTDGTNTAAVKAASTAAVATDPALVVAISPNNPITTTTNKAATSAVTSVAGATSNTVVLASNANRIAAAIYNNTSKNMYLKMGTTASLSSFSIVLMKGAYWEVINDYTGEIDAVWDSGVSGNVLVTELTA